MTKKLIAQGAEAKIFLVSAKAKPHDTDKRSHKSSKATILKSRIAKGYRHPVLDEKLRKSRTKREAKILAKAEELGIQVPRIFGSDTYELHIEYIDGECLSGTLNSYSEKEQFAVMETLGTQVALLHKHNIIHGDLTTSNVILKKTKVFVIDFGLGFISTKIEDKAVDLHLIKQALEAKHFQNHEALFSHFLKGYRLKEKKEILERLRTVEKRGRYRH